VLVERWLRFVVRFRWGVLAVCVALIACAAVLAGRLHKDTSANAYIEPGNPALLYRERVVETFGLKEPIVIAVRSSAAGGILTPAGLRYVRQIVERLEAVPNIDVDRITSLVSRSAIRGGEEGLEVAPLLPAGEIDAAVVHRVRDAIDSSPIYDGTLVSKDRSATIIAAELLDEKRNAETYQAVLDLSRSLPAEQGVEVFVAGAGAITGYFSTYIDRDAGRLVPFTAIAVTVVLFCAFLTIRSAALPMFIAAATIVTTLGVMAASGVAFYAITNGMVVVLIGISVAEPMHVFGEYYALLKERPREHNGMLVVRAFKNVWWPIALTSLTTVVGFFSLWATSTMPPIRYFGLFGAFGVVVAWLLTVSWLPAAMSVLPPKASRLLRHAAPEPTDPVGRAVLALGSAVTRRPRTVLLVSGVVCVVALLAATLVRVDHARIENFNESEPLYVADREINRTLAGTNHLDIVIEADTDEGVLDPEALRKIDGLQRYIRQLGGVGAVTSIVDYLKQLNRAVDGGSESSYVIPDDPSLIAQLMLTYQASAPPTEFQSLIDSSARTALIRVWLRADRWSEQRKVVLAARSYIDRAFGDGPVTATLTGRVMLDYEWVQSVASGHALSVLASTFSVLLMCIVIFRSFRDGLLCLAPLFVSVALVYAVMGLAGIWLGVATSMFAAVAIGLGIDLAIHMVARARKAERMGLATDARILYVYQSTGRAVLFNAAAVGLGFGILMLSAAPPIRMFGVLVATAIVGAFVAALTVLPALLKVLGDLAVRREAVFALLLVCVVVPTARAEDPRDAQHIMQALAARPEGASADRTVRIQLIDRQGGVREQVARAVRKNVQDGRRMAIFYLSPATIRGTSFLVFDYSAVGVANDQWLYLPALRKVRRIPASDRGDYFLGTDLTFDEIRNDNRVTLDDWKFNAAGSDSVDSARCVVVEGLAASEQIARELGYARARWCVDPDILIARRIEYWDRTGNLLKTLLNREPQQIDGVWSATRIEVRNHKTGHGTVLAFESSRFDGQLPDALFTQQQMERGL
jgi:hydrophobe/amphiphile efflux-3 (HAE3) family protein